MEVGCHCGLESRTIPARRIRFTGPGGCWWAMAPGAVIRKRAVRRGVEWLLSAQRGDGGWGRPGGVGTSGVEETAVAVEALLCCGGCPKLGTIGQRRHAFHTGIVSNQFPGLAFRRGAGPGTVVAGGQAVESGRYRESQPIGFYFAKLWYYEQLYPVLFTVSALGQAVLHTSPRLAGSERGSGLIIE